MINKKFWQGKKVLITGHTGFKGSWLACMLHELGSIVYGYALPHHTERDNYVLSHIASFTQETIADIRDEESLFHAFNLYHPDIVFHLAAQPLVRLSYMMPKDTYEINVMGTLHVLEAIRRSSTTKAAVMVTTDKCYENKEQIWGYRENDPMGGFDPYSSSKGCAELLIASYRNSFLQKEGKFAASARAGNVIGGGDWAEDRMIPDCIRSLEAGKPIVVRNPNAIRPWQHVLEPLTGYLLLAERLYGGDEFYCCGWNFGPDLSANRPVRTVVDLVIKEWGSGNWVDASGEESELHEAGILTLDCTKAREYLGWAPKLDLEEGLQHTVSWYKNYKKEDAYTMGTKKIRFYTN